MYKKSILNDTPDTILGWPISEKSQVIWCFLVPSICSSLLYILHFSADFVLCYEHVINENYEFAITTFVIIWAPAIVCLLFTLITVELWPKKGFVYLVGWAVVRGVQHLCFPIWAMYGSAERIFWSIEALRNEGEEREKCLWRSIKTRPIELYFFFQAYLQSAPQMLLQINILLHTNTYLRDDLVNVQIFSIAMSLLNISKVSMYYQHYESQKLLGRRYPWSRRHGAYFVRQKVYDKVTSNEDVPSEPIQSRLQNFFENDIMRPRRMSEPSTSIDGLIQYTEEPTRILTHVEIHHDDGYQSSKASDTDFEELPETGPIYAQLNETTRIRTPDYPAPDPPELNIDAINQTLDSKSLPQRKYPLQARGQDDIIGKIVLFTIWVLFISARILCISVLARFFTSFAIEFLAGHFLITFIVILIYSRSSEIPLKNCDRLIQYLFLSYVYVFCLIEFRIKFRHFYRTLIMYFIVIYTENVIMCVLWYLADWDSWWFNYLFYLIVFSKIMCVLFVIMYILLLKPAKEIIYVIY